MLNNNMFQELTDVDPLATLPKLAHVRYDFLWHRQASRHTTALLALLELQFRCKRNTDCTSSIFCRTYARSISIESLKKYGILRRHSDHCHCVFQEREAARKLYKSKAGEKAKKKKRGANTFVPGADLGKQQQQQQAPRMTKTDADAIKVRIHVLLPQ